MFSLYIIPYPVLELTFNMNYIRLMSMIGIRLSNDILNN